MTILEHRLSTDNLEKLLTHNLETEVLIIASFLRFKSARDKVDRVTPEDFYNEKNRGFFISLRGYIEDNEEFDALDYKRLCKVPISEYSPPDVMEVEFNMHLKRLKEISNLRKIEKLAHSMTVACKENINSVEIKSKYVELLEDIRSSSVGGVTTPEEVDNEFEKDVLNYDYTKNVNTGFDVLDREVNGLYPTKVYVVGGSPGAGKTTFILNLIHNILENDKKVLFASLEMAYKEVAQRMISMMSGVPASVIMGYNYRTQNKEQEEKINQARDKFKKYPLLFTGRGGVSVAELEDKVKYHGDIDVVFIDYLQFLNHAEGTTGYEKVSRSSRDLKLMARKLDIPIVVVASINRENIKRPDKRPMLSNFRDSGNIEYDVDVAFLLYRPAQFQREADEDKAELILAKNRQGKGNNKVFEMEWKPETATFGNMKEQEKKGF